MNRSRFQMVNVLTHDFISLADIDAAVVERNASVNGDLESEWFRKSYEISDMHHNLDWAPPKSAYLHIKSNCPPWWLTTVSPASLFRVPTFISIRIKSLIIESHPNHHLWWLNLTNLHKNPIINSYWDLYVCNHTLSQCGLSLFIWMLQTNLFLHISTTVCDIHSFYCGWDKFESAKGNNNGETEKRWREITNIHILRLN